MDGSPPSRSSPPSCARLATVAAFAQPIEAHLARARLESEGIDCHIADEHIVSVAWMWSAALGGVKLRVPAEQQERARAVLEEACVACHPSSEWLSADLGAPRCPGCGSLRLRDQRFDRRFAVASWLLVGIPLPFFRRRRVCERCGRSWRPSAQAGS